MNVFSSAVTAHLVLGLTPAAVPVPPVGPAMQAITTCLSAKMQKDKVLNTSVTGISDFGMGAGYRLVLTVEAFAYTENFIVRFQLNEGVTQHAVLSADLWQASAAEIPRILDSWLDSYTQPIVARAATDALARCKELR